MLVIAKSLCTVFQFIRQRIGAYILCPDAQTAQFVCARFVKVGTEKIFFDLVKNLELVPFSEDYGQDVRVVRML